jgi:hypothetical protein
MLFFLECCGLIWLAQKASHDTKRCVHMVKEAVIFLIFLGYPHSCLVVGPRSRMALSCAWLAVAMVAVDAGCIGPCVLTHMRGPIPALLRTAGSLALHRAVPGHLDWCIWIGESLASCRTAFCTSTGLLRPSSCQPHQWNACTTGCTVNWLQHALPQVMQVLSAVHAEHHHHHHHVG